jgi:hypothetical protein
MEATRDIVDYIVGFYRCLRLQLVDHYSRAGTGVAGQRQETSGWCRCVGNGPFASPQYRPSSSTLISHLVHGMMRFMGLFFIQLR